MNAFDVFTIFVLAVAAVVIVRGVRSRHRIATRGRFRFTFPTVRRSSIMRTIFPGQSTVAFVQGLDDDGNPVDTGPVTFADPGVPGLTVTPDPDGVHATYAADGTVGAQNIPVSATFVNALGNTITVNDVIQVVNQAAVATHGQFVFAAPTGAAAKA